MTILHDHPPDHCRHVMLYYLHKAELLEAVAAKPLGIDLRWELSTIVDRCWIRGGAYAVMSCPHFEFDRKNFPTEITKM